MGTKLNIAEILKDKPQGTKLYDLLCNMSVKLNTISTTETIVWCSNKTDNKTTRLCCYSEFGTVRGCPDGLQILKPSKSMQDWSKFAWKKGDVLVSKGRRILHVIFEGFNDDTYTTFKGKHYLCDYSDKEDYDEEYYNDYHKEVNERTIEFEKDNVNSAQTYINIIEKRLGGKLNRETLEIEANINVGDVVSDDVLYGICTKVDKSNVYCDFGCDSCKSNAPITNLCLKKENIHVVMLRNKEGWYKEIEKKHHISIDRNTLKVQPEFKDGDILCVIDNSNDYHYILIYEGQDDEHIYRYVTMLENHSLIIKKGSYFTKPKDYSMRYATDKEKQQLFSALAKECKAWDAEKKQIVDLIKVKFKPFDKVLVRDCLDEMWRPSFFACYLPFGREPYQVIGGEWVKLCIPYEGNESLLGTTKDVEG